MIATNTMVTLNEGRGLDPGNTSHPMKRDSTPRRRSTKAGASTPATLVARAVRAFGPVRSTKAGASTPATPRRRTTRRRSRRSLNEGRGLDPGNTGCPWCSCLLLLERSTKAGASTPATPHATGQPPVHALRSTKAGASTPATPRGAARGRGAACPLNEGRGLDPGNTAASFVGSPVLHGAQRRPGPRPRQHITTRSGKDFSYSAQRRPGPRPRQHGTASATCG